jgi:hypothetical protein
MLRWLMRMIGRTTEDHTVLHDLHWVMRGVNNRWLRDLPPLDQAWIDQHSNS